jgi:hypothetical protein
MSGADFLGYALGVSIAALCLTMIAACAVLLYKSCKE